MTLMILSIANNSTWLLAIILITFVSLLPIVSLQSIDHGGEKSTTTGSSSAIIQGFSLLTTTNQIMNPSIQENDTIDLAVANIKSTNLTIQLNFIPDFNTSTIVRVIFDLDYGKLERWETISPFVLGGIVPTTSDYSSTPVPNKVYYEVLTLKELGPHTIKAFVEYHDNDDTTTIDTSESLTAMKEEYNITFYTVDTTIESPPTASPIQSYDVEGYNTEESSSLFNPSPVKIVGSYQLYHPLTFVLSAFPTAEYDPENPFSNYRLSINITTQTNDDLPSTSSSIKSYIVPGYYACDGNASNSGTWNGDIWLVHFTPMSIGNYSYTISFVHGPTIAVFDASTTSNPTANYIDGYSGSFVIIQPPPTEVASKDNYYARGFLQYVGTHNLQYSGTNEDFQNINGANIPRDLLSYTDFDNDDDTTIRPKHTFADYSQYYIDGNPTWMNGKGKGIMGLLNNLKQAGSSNTITFTTLDTTANIIPFTKLQTPSMMDCSKLAQWDVVFQHATNLGFVLQFQLVYSSDMPLSIEQEKIYYREIIARFSYHPAIIWNIGATVAVNNFEGLAKYIRDIDPCNHPIFITVRNDGSTDEATKSLLGNPFIDGIILMNVTSTTLSIDWIEQSTNAGHPWIVVITDYDNNKEVDDDGSNTTGTTIISLTNTESSSSLLVDTNPTIDVTSLEKFLQTKEFGN